MLPIPAWAQRAPLSAPLLFLSAGLLVASGASATAFNTHDAEDHEAWQSLVLSLGEERHYRALEWRSYSDSLLSVNHTPGACESPWIELRVDLDEHQAEDRVVNRVPADLRVDLETIHSGQAQFFTRRGDSGFYVHFQLEEQPQLLAEMRQGEILRLRLMRAEDDPWFMIFDLDGAEAALERAGELCRADRPAT